MSFSLIKFIYSKSSIEAKQGVDSAFNVTLTEKRGLNKVKQRRIQNLVKNLEAFAKKS